MVSPIRKEMTFRQAKPHIKNSILSNHTPPLHKKKDSVSTESLCRYEELIYIIYLYRTIFYFWVKITIRFQSFVL